MLLVVFNPNKFLQVGLVLNGKAGAYPNRDPYSDATTPSTMTQQNSLVNMAMLHSKVIMRSAKANGREPKSCLGQVFSLKLDHFVMHTIARHAQA